MNKCVKNTDRWGRVLWLTDGAVEVGVALDFGIRVVHLSCSGCENLFYVQPEDLSDGFITEDGWKLYGGHRIWMAPESDDTYWPDNHPVTWEETQDGVMITQAVDPILGIRKSLAISFLSDGGIQLNQTIQNASESLVNGASWGINTLDGGGTATISFSNCARLGYTPHRVVSLWADTDLHDPRLSFEKDCLRATYMPLPDYLKIGLYCLEGKAVFENKGQRFTLCFDTLPLDRHPDNGCNFELYMCRQFIELETLGAKAQLQPGQSTSHRETWYLSRI